MVKKYTEYSKEVVRILKEKDPELYKYLQCKDVNFVFRFFVKKVKKFIFQKKLFVLNNFFFLYPKLDKYARRALFKSERAEARAIIRERRKEYRIREYFRDIDDLI